jgi:hypothetical protein
MKKFISVLLLLSLLMFMIFTVSCNREKDKTDNSATDSSDQTGDNAQTGDGEQSSEPELPEINLDGKDFVIMTSNWGDTSLFNQRDIGAEEQTGDTINDAVYMRNDMVNGKFNCRIVAKATPYNDASTEIIKLVQSGDNSVDAATIQLKHYGQLAPTNSLVDFKNLVYIDASKPWWDSNSVKSLSIDHRLFGAVSDITLTDKDGTTALVFNKALAKNMDLGDLYQLVYDGKWTIDKLYELSRTVPRNADGSKPGDTNTVYGLMYHATP